MRILEFAAKERLLLLADEAQQDCLLTEDGRSWLSFRRLASELQIPVQLCSLHSASQLEEGARWFCLEGSFLHCHNFGPKALEAVRQLASSRGSASLLSQGLVASCLTPLAGDSSSSAQCVAERAESIAELNMKATIAVDRFNAMEGMSCHTVHAGRFVYPKLIIKGHVMKKAISFATAADQIYCLELAERTGVGLMPGSGFGQRPGYFHFRLSLDGQKSIETLEEELAQIAKFHVEHPIGWFL